MQERHINPHFRRQKAASWQELDPEQWIEQIRNGNMPALSKAISLLENQKPEARKKAGELLRLAMPHTGNALRIGLTGIPGAGKSTMIESLGQHFVDAGKKMAVLAVDPSSGRTGGSILGDKTRMEQLSRNPNVFIRPSPSGGQLGGVAKTTRETMYLCEAAGFDLILVETVGVGQSEIEVKRMTDIFILITIPGAGDELQGIKRGIMEMADLIIVNKAEGTMKPAAEIAARQLRNALRFLPANPNGIRPQVLLAAALSNEGIPQVAKVIRQIEQQLIRTGHLEISRNIQARDWMFESLRQRWEYLLQHHPALRQIIAEKQQEIALRNISPFDAADAVWMELLQIIRNENIDL